jgi:protein-L-isoaspartate(D-aspartate) O-methyltransferase
VRYVILADLTVFVHALFVLFVVCGGVAVLRWRRLAWLHLPAAIWGAMIELIGWVCPLTYLENRLRRLGGESGYSGTFIERYLEPVIYPFGLTDKSRILLGLFVIVVNLLVYLLLFKRSRQRKNRPGGHMRTIVIICAAVLAATLVPAAAVDTYHQKRFRMVEQDIGGRGVKERRLLEVMATVPRHLFVDARLREQAYEDHPLPIGEGQTISQPYVVALMTEALRLRPTDRVLEIGTGSGYQAAVLAGLVKDVYSVEIRKPLADVASGRLKELGYGNVRVRYGDGYFGWEEAAPFDAIIITAAANHIPPPLIRQLREGGRLILPLASTVFYQTLTLVTKTKGGKLVVEQMGPVRFVPMTGEAQKK